MNKKLVLIVAVVCALAFAGTSLAAAPKYTGTVITYDGWLHQNYTGQVFTNIVADTLIVVTNGHPGVGFKAYIQVYDKTGTTLEGQGAFFVGHNPPVQSPTDDIAAQSYGWITLGQLVSRGTVDPWNFPDRGEKFVIQISTSTGIPPIVEIKQVIYTDYQLYVAEAIWNTYVYHLWTETSLGGKRGNGVVYAPSYAP